MQLLPNPALDFIETLNRYKLIDFLSITHFKSSKDFNEILQKGIALYQDWHERK